MKFSINLKTKTKPEWVKVVLDDFNSFLQDHADCERKASSMCMSFVAKYPNRVEIIPELIETAIEELEHFQDVNNLLESKKVQLPHKIQEDIYVKQLIKKCRNGRDERFLDRLLLASILETRGAERFRIVADALPLGDLKTFYKKLWTSEAKHANMFVKMALNYFEKEEVYTRLEEMIILEGEILDKIPLRAALH